jgi:hypothetical protein
MTTCTFQPTLKSDADTIQSLKHVTLCLPLVSTLSIIQYILVMLQISTLSRILHCNSLGYSVCVNFQLDSLQNYLLYRIVCLFSASHKDRNINLCICLFGPSLLHIISFCKSTINDNNIHFFTTLKVSC